MFRQVLFVLGLTVSSVYAQECTCTVKAIQDAAGNRELFAVGQVRNGSIADACDYAVATESSCYTACQDAGRDWQRDKGVCGEHYQNNLPECYGDGWCDGIHSLKPGANPAGTFLLRAFADLSGCADEGKDFTDLEVAQADYQQTLCCRDAGDGSSEQTACTPGGTSPEDCQCELKSNCECGTLIAEMTAPGFVQGGVQPVPLFTVAKMFEGDDLIKWEDECREFPPFEGQIELDLCSAFCKEKYNEQKAAGLTLSGDHPHRAGYKLGEVMCAIYKEQAGKGYEAINNANLTIHGRVKGTGCNQVGWADLNMYGWENLCCDDDGEWLACA